MSKGQWIWPVVSALLVLVLGNLFTLATEKPFLKNFKPQELDMYVTEEQIKAQMNVRNVEIFQTVFTFFKEEIK